MFNCLIKKKMKKVIISALSLCMLVSVSSFASSSEDFLTKEKQQVQQDKVKIKKHELPEAARKTLDEPAYKGWSFEQAYKLPNGEYEVELKKDGAMQTISFDQDGKVK
jgi:hypothetical protein